MSVVDRNSSRAGLLARISDLERENAVLKAQRRGASMAELHLEAARCNVASSKALHSWRVLEGFKLHERARAMAEARLFLLKKGRFDE
jgi:hypothetical protein